MRFGLARGAQALPPGCGWRFRGPNWIEADDHRLAPLGGGVEGQDAVALGGEVGVVGALPGPHRLKADTLGCQQLPQPLVGDVRDHPLGDQVVGQLGQAPGGERQVEGEGVGERDLLDLSPLRQGEGRRATAAVTRVERLEAVAVEVVDQLAHRVGVGEDDLADARRALALGGQQHDLCSPPGDHRTRGAAHDAQQPVALLIADLAQRHPGRHLRPLSPTGFEARVRRPGPQALLRQAGKRCRILH